MKPIDLVKDFLREAGFRPSIHRAPGGGLPGSKDEYQPVLCVKGPTSEVFTFLFWDQKFACWANRLTGDVFSEMHRGDLAHPKSLERLEQFIRSHWGFPGVVE